MVLLEWLMGWRWPECQKLRLPAHRLSRVLFQEFLEDTTPTITIMKRTHSFIATTGHIKLELEEDEADIIVQTTNNKNIKKAVKEEKIIFVAKSYTW